MSLPPSEQGRQEPRYQGVCPLSPRAGFLAGPEFSESEPRAASTEGARPGPVVGNTRLLFCISAFNIVLNFGIAVTYPTLMSLGIVLSVPVNAGRCAWLCTTWKQTGTHSPARTGTHAQWCPLCQGHALCPAQGTALGHNGDGCCVCNRFSILD